MSVENAGCNLLRVNNFPIISID